MKHSNTAYLIYENCPYGSKDVDLVYLDLEQAKSKAETLTRLVLKDWQDEPLGRDWVNQWPWTLEWEDNPDKGWHRFLLWQEETDGRYTWIAEGGKRCWFPIREIAIGDPQRE